MRESSVESIFAQRVRTLGGLSYKFAPVHSGNPDRIVLMPNGIVRFVELKADRGALRPDQRLWHRRAAELGTVVHVVTGAEEARQWTP
ncbi:MAG: VRR-NUC domain-containing protein [Dermatophilaceae bacterium]|nr:VRR-NUC domain-containing protein [Intrasporangiaceae bacterium]